jgi:hypothetical protein
MPAFSRKLIAIVLLGLLFVLLLLGSLSRCTQLVTAKKEARVARGQAEAAADAGAEAMNTISNVEAADRSADRIHEEGLDAIRKAPEGKSGAAAVDTVCRLRLYRDSQRCAALRTAGPGEPAPPD